MLSDLRNALPYIAGAMASQFGVRILQGASAMTDCKNTIYLPPLPNNDRKTMIKALGFIGHESAHIHDTDPGVLDDIKTESEKGLLNNLEDIRIDRKQMIRFPGFADTRAEMFQNLVEDNELFVPDENSHPFQIMERFIHYTLRHDYLNQVQLEPAMKATETVFRSKFPRGVQIRLEALMFEVEQCKATRDVLDLARSILTMVEEEADKEEQEQEQQKQEQQQSNDNQQSSTNDQGDDSGGDPGEPGDTSKDDDDQPDDSSVGGKSGDDGTDMVEMLRQVGQAGSNDQVEELGQMLARQLNVKSRETPSREKVEVFNATRQHSLGMNHIYDQECRKLVNALSQRMHSLMQDETMSHRIRKDFGTRLAVSHLHEARITGKVFEQKYRQEETDAAISFLVDVSISTKKIVSDLAKIAYATASSLAVLEGVKVAVSAFPMPGGVQYLSDFDEMPQSSSANFAALDAGGSTPMAEAIYRNGIDLLMQPQQKKMLIVITDGEPNDSATALQAIEATAAADVEVYGVGIGVNLSNLFDHWTTIDILDELPERLFTMVSGSLLQKAA